MCAFIDELVDVFGDDVELAPTTSKNVHPYLPKRFPKPSGETLHDKFTTDAEADRDSQEDSALESEEADSIVSKTHQYLPSPSGKHHPYLQKHREPEPPTKDENQDNVEVVSDIATSSGDETQHQSNIEVGAKPFRRPSSAMHSYLFQNQSSERPNSSALVDESIEKDAPQKMVEAKSEEREGQENRDFPGEKLDIDAMIAALPSKAVEPKKGAPLRERNYADAKLILQDNPALHDRLSGFLCYETTGYSPTHLAFPAGDIQFCVPAR